MGKIGNFKFLRDNTVFFEGNEIVEVHPLIYIPESFQPQRDVSYRYTDNGDVYRITVHTDHPQWNELRERYP